MATITATDDLAGAFNDLVDVYLLATWDVVSQSATSFGIEVAGDTRVIFNGSGFGSYSDNFSTTGTVTSVEVYEWDVGTSAWVRTVDWTGLSALASALQGAVTDSNHPTGDADFLDELFGGNDVMNGASSFQDTLYGYAGDDTIRTFGGDDQAFGGDGDDYVIGDTGTDQLYGDAGDDVVYAFDGTVGDVYDGGTGGETTGDTLNAFGIGNIDHDASVNLTNATLANFEALTFNRATTDVDYFAIVMSGTQAQTAFSNTTAVTGNVTCSEYLWIQDVGGNLDVSTWTFNTWNSATDIVRIDGGAGGNTIDGASNQKNTLNGGGGSDAIYGGSVGDQLYGSLNVGDGAIDNMYGGDGADVYAVYELTDIIHEDAGGTGTDYAAVSANNYVMVANLEAIAMFGAAVVATGNALGNSMQGNNAAADTLSGLAGADFLYGQIGDDTLLGGGDNDTLEGGAGADLLDGGAGNDSMIGGGGNDTYIVNAVGDVTTETASTGGVDLVKSSVTHTLGTNLENLTLTTSAAINGTGNTRPNIITGNNGVNTLSGLDGADTIVGGAGGDTIIGGVGKDTLTGGIGGDKFVLNAAAVAGNADTITDFTHNSDKIQLENSVFTALGAATGTLANTKFWVGTGAHDADDRIIYDNVSGKLYYDANGNVAGQKVLIATLDAGLTITNTDFQVI
ncbi:MAG: calcium-binding protein [Hyphomonadaceae bacterium]|nr:calcium-binding protein [Hyphomonadaceae bacterium]